MVKTFVIPVFNPEPAEHELNDFISRHRTVEVERRFVDNGAQSFWAVWVTFAKDGRSSEGRRSTDPIDYKEVLEPQDFALFSRLRELRKKFAEEERVPAYRVFTNQQLAEMARQRVETMAALEAITGVGPARGKKYGEAFLKEIAVGVNPQEGAPESHEDEPG